MLPIHDAESAFVGRDEEIAILEAALDEAVSGRLRWVALVGEPGVGKTRTAAELAARSAARGIPAFWGRSQDVEGAPAYWPWSRILEAFGRTQEPVRLAELLHDDDLLRVAPGLARSAGLPAPPSRSPPDPDARYRAFASVADFLRDATERAPLVLVFDDLQWADPSSVHLLRFVASELTDSRLLLLCTYRTDAEASGSTTALHEALARSGTLVPLQRLTAPAQAELVVALLGYRPSDQLLATIDEAAGGNPLYTREVVRLMQAQGTLSRDSAGRPAAVAPEPIGATVRRRLQDVDPELTELLSLASVVGAQVDLAVLVAVSRAPRPTVVRALDAGVRAGVLAEPDAGATAYRFSHAVVRDALYQTLPAVERAHVHVRVAEAITSLHADHPGPELATIAHHYQSAAVFHSAEPAVAYASRAARYAVERGAYDAAAENYERALAVLPLLPEDAKRHAELLIALGGAHGLAGDLERAREVLEQAAALAAELGGGELMAEAVVSLGEILDETGYVDRSFIALLEDAASRLPAGDHPWRPLLLGRLSQALYFTADRERCDEASADAVEMARRLGDPEVLAKTLMFRHFALWVPGRAAERLAIISEVQALQPDLHTRLYAHAWRLLDLFELGDMDGVDEELDHYESLAASARLPRFDWHVTMVHATLATLHGDLGHAEELAVRASRYSGGGGLQNVGQFFMVQLFELRRQQGRLADFVSMLVTKATGLRTFPSWRAALALVHLELGNPEGARVELDTLAARGFSDIPRDGMWLACMALVAEVCHGLRDADRAARVYELLLPHASEVIVLGTTAGSFGAVSRFLGLLASTLGRAAATQHFETALEINARLGARGLLARTQLELARHLSHAGAPDASERARRLHQEAAATARHLGMDALTALAASIQGSSPVPEDVAAPTGPARFEREGGVWTVCFGGRTTHLSDLKGAAYLATLLGCPGREVHVLDLIASTLSDETPMPASDPGFEVVDAQARAAYRERLSSLREELAEAERCQDIGRIDRLTTELDFVAGQLAGALGLGGRPRRTASGTERARINVTRAIGRVVRKLRSSDIALGHHLETHVMTGTFCCYKPDPARPVPWQT